MTFETFKRVVDHALAAPASPDLVLLTGDLVQDDSPEAYDHFAALLQAFEVPVLCLPGNHDLRDVMQKKFARDPFAYCAVRDIGNWRIVNLDSCVDGSAGGRIAESELDRLDAALSLAPADHAIICLHHPPVLTGSAWLDSVGLDERDAFLDAAAAHDSVRAVLGGHVHQDIDTVVTRSGRPIRVIATPSTCRQFKPLSRRFAVDDLPPAYRRLDLHENGSIDSELVWVTV